MTNGEGKKRKFNPSASAAATKEAIISANADFVSSLSVTEYKNAMSAVSRFLDPESSTNDDICTFSESGRTSTIFRPKIVQDVIPGPSGYFRIFSNPRFYRPLGMTDYSKNLPNQFEAARTYALKQGADVRMVVPFGKPSNVPLTFMPDPDIYKPLPAAELIDLDSKCMFIPEWNQEANGGGWFYRFSTPRSINCSLRLNCWRTFGTPSVIITVLTDVGTYVSNTLTATTTGNENLGFLYFHPSTNILGFTFHVRTPTVIHSHGISLDFGVGLGPDEECIHFVDSAISYTVQDASDAYINLGMSCWVQYTGADLVNGGESTGYRYPPDNLAKYNSLRQCFSTVSSTPGALVGKIKQGAWSFYLPQTASELDYKPLESYDGLGYILIAGKKNSEEASVRVNFNQVLLVSTTNQAFSKQIVSADPAALAAALTMLRNAAGVIENDGHQERIRKAKAYLKAQYPSIKKGVKTAAQVAKVAAPIIAALF